jgi:hypothetical protein
MPTFYLSLAEVRTLSNCFFFFRRGNRTRVKKGEKTDRSNCPLQFKSHPKDVHAPICKKCFELVMPRILTKALIS